jgi:ABC-type multidrug transport system ATPase subunit
MDSERDDVLATGSLVFAGRFDARQRVGWRETATHGRFFRTRTVLECDRSGVAFPLGRITAVIGPSGAGKTTLMRMAAGRAFGAGVRVDGLWIVRRAHAGFPLEGTHDGRPLHRTDRERRGDGSGIDDGDIAGGERDDRADRLVWERVSASAMRRKSAFVDQADDALDPASTPRDIVRFYVDSLHRAAVPSADERRAIVDRALGDARLRGRAASTPCGRLSGGQRKRTSIAVQLARNRGIVFMDEPTSGLDSASSEAVFDAIARINRRRATTVVMVVHHPSERMIARVHRLVLVAAGVVVYQGAPGRALSFLAACALAAPSPPSPRADGAADAAAADAPRGDRKEEIDEEKGKIEDDDAVDDDDETDDDDYDEAFARRARTSVPDRIVALVAQAADEPDADYDQRMRELASRRAPLPPGPRAPRRAGHGEDGGEGNDDDDDGDDDDYDDNNGSGGSFIQATAVRCADGYRDGASASTARGSTDDGHRPERPCRRAGPPALRRFLSALLCWMALCGAYRRRYVTLAAVAKLGVKYTVLPALIAATMASSVRSDGQDAVTGAHSVASMTIVWAALDAAWEVVLTLPSLDRQYIKHWEDGLYGAATHLSAAHAADSLMRVPLLLVYCAIIYWGAGLRSDAGRFAVFVAGAMLAALVARSASFACTCWLRTAYALMALSLLMSATIVVGGIYMPFGIMPEYARVLTYASFLTYAMSIVARNQFEDMTYSCSPDRCTYRTGDDAIADFAAEGAPVWLCFLVLAASAALLAVVTWALLTARARLWRRV